MNEWAPNVEQIVTAATASAPLVIALVEIIKAILLPLKSKLGRWWAPLVIALAQIVGVGVMVDSGMPLVTGILAGGMASGVITGLQNIRGGNTEKGENHGV